MTGHETESGKYSLAWLRKEKEGVKMFNVYPVGTPVYVETFLGNITGIYRGKTNDPGRVHVEVTATRHGYKKGANITPVESTVVPREHVKKGERTTAGKFSIPG